jgi:hypothetical protein
MGHRDSGSHVGGHRRRGPIRTAPPVASEPVVPVRRSWFTRAISADPRRPFDATARPERAHISTAPDRSARGVQNARTLAIHVEQEPGRRTPERIGHSPLCARLTVGQQKTAGGGPEVLIQVPIWSLRPRPRQHLCGPTNGKHAKHATQQPGRHHMDKPTEPLEPVVAGSSPAPRAERIPCQRRFAHRRRPVATRPELRAPQCSSDAFHRTAPRRPEEQRLTSTCPSRRFDPQTAPLGVAGGLRCACP